MALCQVVPFEFEITVNGLTTPENGVISIIAGWSTETTSGGLFGYDETVNPLPESDPDYPDRYGIIAAFIDIDDGSYTDPLENARVDSYTTFIQDPAPSKKGEIQGTFIVSGLDNGDKVVMEVWLVLDCEFTDGATGNVQSRLISAQTVAETPQTINTGSQTVPLLQVSSFLDTKVHLSVYKFDDNEPALEPGRMWKNTIVVSAGPDNTTGDYVANGVTIVDKLDKWVELVDENYYDPDLHPFGYTITEKYTRTCSYAAGDPGVTGGILTCDLKGISEAATGTTEGVIENVVTIEYWLSAIDDVPTGSMCEGIMETQPATTIANSGPGCLDGYDVMNRVDLYTISADQNPGDNWDEEPKRIISGTNAVEIEYFEATGQFRSVLLEWKTVSELNNLGFNVYRAFRINGPRVRINAELIPADIFGQGGSEYAYLDIGLFPRRTYFYWLEDVDFDGTTTFYGPVSAMVTRK